MMLTGNYTPPKIADIANKRWGLKSLKGRPINKSTFYQLFSNPFYSGWFEYPGGSGIWHKGNHEAMTTSEEYERVQVLLRRKGKPRLKKHEFAFTGLIRCGECGAMVTAEEKNQVICSKCKNKFSSNNTSECPRCHTLIEKMQKPVILHYVYYHCTKQINPNCTQGSIVVEELEKQVDLFLSNIHISEDFKNWAIKKLKEESENETISRESILSSQRKTYDGCLKKLDNLFQLKISPANTDGSLLPDEEYGKRKTELLREKARLEEILNDISANVEKWLETGGKLFNFACYSRYWLEHGSPREKFEILKALGSNLILRDKKILLEPHIPFVAVGEITAGVPEARDRFEPNKFGLNKEDLNEIYAMSPIVSAAMYEIRTWIMTNNENFYVPVLADPSQFDL